MVVLAVISYFAVASVAVVVVSILVHQDGPFDLVSSCILGMLAGLIWPLTVLFYVLRVAVKRVTDKTNEL